MEQNNKSLSNFDAFKRLLTPFVADYPLLQMDQGGEKLVFYGLGFVFCLSWFYHKYKSHKNNTLRR